MFGTLIELVWGSRRFLVYYFTCVVGAAIVHLAVLALMSSGPVDPIPTVGASGGVFGILLAFGLRFPNQYILLLIPPIPIKAKYFVVIFGAVELYFGITGTQAGVAHFAHLGGMAAGLLLILYWRGKLPWKPRYREL
jgi:membrane associated rhomboid family serine protease